jgi:hypothetical protein
MGLKNSFLPVFGELGMEKRKKKFTRKMSNRTIELGELKGAYQDKVHSLPT